MRCKTVLSPWLASSLIVLVFLFFCNSPPAGASGTPHVIYGKVFNAGGSTPNADDIEVYAYIPARPEEILDKYAMRCGYAVDSLSEGWLWCEAGNLTTPWSLNDAMRLMVINPFLQQTGVIDLSLTSAGNQRFADLYLASGDSIGPIASNALIDGTSPASIPEGTQDIGLTAIIDDLICGNNNIQNAEYFIDTDPGYGFGIAMTSSDGGFDSPQEEVVAVIDTASWTEGSTYTVHVCGQDAADNWGTSHSVVVSVTERTAPAPGDLDGDGDIDGDDFTLFLATFGK